MKKLLALAFALIMVVQVPAAVAVEGHSEYPTCQLDMRKMIDILADYDVEHQRRISGGAYWGLTVYQDQIIYLDSTPDIAIRKLTVIHEMLHVCYNAKGIDTSEGFGEQLVQIKAQQLYLKIYGEDK